jgi:hypothetical protein
MAYVLSSLHEKLEEAHWQLIYLWVMGYGMPYDDQKRLSHVARAPVPIITFWAQYSRFFRNVINKYRRFSASFVPLPRLQF